MAKRPSSYSMNTLKRPAIETLFFQFGATTSQATTSQLTNGQATTGQATTSQATTGQATNGQATTGQATTRQATTEKPESIGQLIESIINKQELSDVCFVFADKTKIYGHKLIFALSSDVFKQMFFGSLKEERKEIEISDLTPIGFTNMMRFFYTKRFHMNSTEIYETYLAANKYLCNKLMSEMNYYILAHLGQENAFEIYAQLTKVEEKFFGIVTPIMQVKRYIMSHEEPFKNAAFANIRFETLVSVLNFVRLKVSEIELLKACIWWVQAELVRKKLKANAANKYEVFAKIKNLINFSRLNVLEFGKVIGIENYLNNEEITSIFLHLSNFRNPPCVRYSSKRGNRIGTHFVQASHDSTNTFSENRTTTSYFRGILTVNKPVIVQSILVSYPENRSFLSFELLDDDSKELIKKTFYISFPSGLIEFDDLVLLEPALNYEISFKFNESNSFIQSQPQKPMSVSGDTMMKTSDGMYIFNYHSEWNHCIKKINFSAL